MMNTTLNGWATRVAPSTMTAGLSASITTLRHWVARLLRQAEERRYLLAMDERELRDIGLTRYDAVAEATKTWWKR